MMHASTARPSRHATTRAARRPARKSGLGGTLVGIFIGMALGLGLSSGVAFYLMKTGNPYQQATGRDAKDPTRGRTEPAADKPRFDFYKILPGVEEAKLPAKSPGPVAPDKATIERAA